jgi:hypothetical protein
MVAAETMTPQVYNATGRAGSKRETSKQSRGRRFLQQIDSVSQAFRPVSQASKAISQASKAISQAFGTVSQAFKTAKPDADILIRHRIYGGKY